MGSIIVAAGLGFLFILLLGDGAGKGQAAQATEPEAQQVAVKPEVYGIKKDFVVASDPKFLWDDFYVVELRRAADQMVYCALTTDSGLKVGDEVEGVLATHQHQHSQLNTNYLVRAKEK